MVDSCKYLDIIIDNGLKCREHIDHVHKTSGVFCFHSLSYLYGIDICGQIFVFSMLIQTAEEMF